ncbi:hypothetical protein CASFOL_041544 [Castilleja foliolosa]|uniref:Uncharacterized protein n=1 Tax=Castilleja foliolosa TaxID=1961234 RepID=A0ABD3BAR5_9LAMI
MFELLGVAEHLDIEAIKETPVSQMNDQAQRQNKTGEENTEPIPDEHTQFQEEISRQNEVNSQPLVQEESINKRQEIKNLKIPLNEEEKELQNKYNKMKEISSDEEIPDTMIMEVPMQHTEANTSEPVQENVQNISNTENEQYYNQRLMEEDNTDLGFISDGNGQSDESNIGIQMHSSAAHSENEELGGRKRRKKYEKRIVEPNTDRRLRSSKGDKHNH